MIKRISSILAIGILGWPLVAGAEHREDAGDLLAEAKVVVNYIFDTQLSPFDIEVEVRQGTALLTGAVGTAELQQRAARLAREVEGVTVVDNRILLDENIPHNRARFDGEDAVSDANVTAMVKAQLLWNRMTHALEIDVEVEDGVVTLSGDAQSQAAADEAARIAGNTRMVEQVNNRLKIE